jgi:hypothetical protein
LKHEQRENQKMVMVRLSIIKLLDEAFIGKKPVYALSDDALDPFSLFPGMLFAMLVPIVLEPVRWYISMRGNYMERRVSKCDPLLQRYFFVHLH